MIITRTVAALSILAAVLVGCSSSSGSSGSSSSTPSATPTPYQTLTATQLSTYRAHIRDLPCDSLAALQDETLSHRDQLAFEAIAAQEQAPLPTALETKSLPPQTKGSGDQYPGTLFVFLA